MLQDHQQIHQAKMVQKMEVNTLPVVIQNIICFFLDNEKVGAKMNANLMKVMNGDPLKTAFIV